MRAYWSFARCAFARGLAYRFNLLLRVVGNLVNVLIQVAIWRALIGHAVIAGVSLRVMVTYAILSTCLGMVLLVNLFHAVDERLRTGNIGIDLVQWLLTVVVPLAFINFYPAALVLHKGGAVLPSAAGWATPLVGLGALLAAYGLFRRGVGRYQGAGG